MSGEVIAPAWKLFGKRISPGFYAYAGALYIDAEELCAVAGVPYTPENLDALVAGVSQAAQDYGVDVVEMVS